MSETVPNRYREELERALRHERFRASVASELLDTVQKALTNGAWTSTYADLFAAECQTHRTTLINASDGVVGTLEKQLGIEPLMVEERDWRARFKD